MLESTICSDPRASSETRFKHLKLSSPLLTKSCAERPIPIPNADLTWAAAWDAAWAAASDLVDAEWANMYGAAPILLRSVRLYRKTKLAGKVGRPENGRRRLAPTVRSAHRGSRRAAGSVLQRLGIPTILCKKSRTDFCPTVSRSCTRFLCRTLRLSRIVRNT